MVYSLGRHNLTHLKQTTFELIVEKDGIAQNCIIAFIMRIFLLFSTMIFIPFNKYTFIFRDFSYLFLQRCFQSLLLQICCMWENVEKNNSISWELPVHTGYPLTLSHIQQFCSRRLSKHPGKNRENTHIWSYNY